MNISEKTWIKICCTLMVILYAVGLYPYWLHKFLKFFE